MKISYFALFLAVLFISTNVNAQVAVNSGLNNQFEVSPRVGTLGLGLDFGYRASESLGFRVSNNYLAGNTDQTIEGIKYKVDGSLYNGGLVLDYYPLKKSLRLSAGGFFSLNQLDLDISPTTNLNIGSSIYTPTEIGKLTGSIETPKFSPYLGVGYNYSFGNYGLNFDAGALYYSKQLVKLRSVGGSLTGSAGLNTSLAREIDEIENQADNYFIPVIMLGFSIYF